MTSGNSSAIPTNAPKMQHLLEIYKLLQREYMPALQAVAGHLISHFADWCLISRKRDGSLQFDAIAHTNPPQREKLVDYLNTEPLDPERLQNWNTPQLTKLTGSHASLSLPIEGRTGLLGYLSVGLLDPEEVSDPAVHLVLENTAALLANMIEHDALNTQVYSLGTTVHTERNRLYNVLQLLPVGILIVDRMTRQTILSNREMDRLQGNLSPQNESVAAVELPDGQPLPTDDEPLTRALAGDTIRNIELVVVRPNGVRTPIVASAMPLFDNSDKIEGAMLVWQDVSVLKDAQHTRELLLSAASHELRTPLTSLLGFGQLLETRPDALPERREKWLGYMNEKARYLARLVEELIGLSRAQTGWMQLNTELIDFRAVLQTVLAEVRSANMGRVYHLTEPAESVLLLIDREKILQVVSNLLSNAALYSPVDTPIDMTLEVSERKIRLSVRDYGMAIPLEEQQHIFQPFYRAEAAYRFEGTGLGLAVANSYVELHRGHLWVISSGIAGEGSTFMLELPRPS